jgi:hypothetical protein
VTRILAQLQGQRRQISCSHEPTSLLQSVLRMMGRKCSAYLRNLQPIVGERGKITGYGVSPHRRGRVTPMSINQ